MKKYPNTTSGVEPIFSAFYFRKKKVNPSDKNVRIDFVDQNGDSWTSYPIVMGGFKEWLDIHCPTWESFTEEEMNNIFTKSPYYLSTANDISWEKRVMIQAIVQKYTTNAISSTINLPKDVSKETVKGIYIESWKKGLKGVTIYRDGCRTGVLTTTNSASSTSFEYKDSAKRPKEIEGDIHVITVKGVKYGVIVGTIDGNPYELFAFNLPDNIKQTCNNGKLIKIKSGHYDFTCGEYTLKDIQQIAVRKDEQVLTRLVSGMLRHGAKPQFVMEQIDKCELEVVSFAKAVSRVLKKYCKEEELINRNTCKDCGSSDLRMQEGCLTCNSCGASKCG